MATIGVLNDDCLYEVFKWLTLREKCAVERVKKNWSRVIRDMISGEDTLELFIEDPTPFGKPQGCPKAYYSSELEEFFETGFLNDEVEAFIQRFSILKNPLFVQAVLI